jgi:hypothetical protein
LKAAVEEEKRRAEILAEKLQRLQEKEVKRIEEKERKPIGKPER